MKDLVFKKRISGLTDILKNTEIHCSEDVYKAAALIISTYHKNGAVFVFGNGGSAADAQHIVGELNGRFLYEREGLKAYSLVGDAATMTCISNDYGFTEVFSRQIAANGAKGDVAWGISTSGKSENVLKALEVAKSNGLKTILLTGAKVSDELEFIDIIIKIPSKHTPHIQEVGVLIYHTICELVELEFTKNNL